MSKEDDVALANRVLLRCLQDAGLLATGGTAGWRQKARVGIVNEKRKDYSDVRLEALKRIDALCGTGRSSRVTWTIREISLMTTHQLLVVAEALEQIERVMG